MDGLANFRDVGTGLPVGTVALGVLFRSDAPFVGDAPPTADAWPPAAIVDLRDPIESKGAHPLAELALVHNVPLLPSLDRPKDGVLGKRLPALYEVMLGEHAAAGLVRAVRIVAESRSTLIHCAAGKDRTGVTVAFLLRLVGIDRDPVIADYLRTNDSRQDLARRLEAQLGLALSAEMIDAPIEAITVALDGWDAHPGGTEGWYLERGGDKGTLVALRERLLAGLVSEIPAL